MPDRPVVTIIIVSWNVADSLARCLESVFTARYPQLEVIVIDNASTDNSVKIAESFPDVKVIANTKNLGFPKAVNIGLRQSRGDYLLLLNPDARLPQFFFTTSLEFFATHPDAGLMGPKFIDPDGTPQGSVFPEPSVVATLKEFWLGAKGKTAKYTPPDRRPLPVNCVSGACMFFPRSTLDKIGYFTEAVFMYYEDLDYCRRLRHAGLKVYFNPDITIIHEHGSSTRQSPLAKKYLTEASLWYNGPLKHHLMWLISWSGQKLRHLQNYKI